MWLQSLHNKILYPAPRRNWTSLNQFYMTTKWDYCNGRLWLPRLSSFSYYLHVHLKFLHLNPTGSIRRHSPRRFMNWELQRAHAWTLIDAVLCGSCVVVVCCDLVPVDSSISCWITSGRYDDHLTWWRHQMETFSALLAVCAGKSSVPCKFPRTKASDAELGCFLWSASE